MSNVRREWQIRGAFFLAFFFLAVVFFGVVGAAGVVTLPGVVGVAAGVFAAWATTGTGTTVSGAASSSCPIAGPDGVVTPGADACGGTMVPGARAPPTPRRNAARFGVPGAAGASAALSNVIVAASWEPPPAVHAVPAGIGTVAVTPSALSRPAASATVSLQSISSSG